MKLMKILGAAAVAAMALMAFASTASATTLYKEGTAQTGAVTIKASSAGAVLKNTSGSIANECESTVEGTTSTFTGTAVTGSISSLTFKPCKEESVVVDKAGTLSVEYTSGLNGTVKSNGAEVTVPSPFGKLTCKTSNTDIGQITGVNSGNATMDINAVLNCGILLPSAKWEGTYTVTSPSGLSVGS